MAKAKVKSDKKEQQKAALARPETYDVIVAPWVTEKAARGSEHSQVTFKVALNATKPEIKVAVEALFGVDVKAVNTIRQQGKLKKFRGRPGVRSDYKKAIVTLEKGQTIDVTSSI